MTEPQPANYETIFKDQGVPKELRGPDDYFFHTVTEDESIDHAGETYAIPRQLYLPGVDEATYTHQENGALVSTDTDVGPDVKIENRAIVSARLLTGETTIGRHSVIGVGARLLDATIASDVKVGSKAAIDGATIDSGSKLGQVLIRGGGTPSMIGTGVTLEDGVQLEGNNQVGYDSSVGKKSKLLEGATVGPEVRIDEKVRVGTGANVRYGSRVLEGSIIGPGKNIRPATLVYPGRVFMGTKRTDSKS